MQVAGNPAPEVAGNITVLLKQWWEGDQESLNQVITLVYQDLRRMAAFYLNDSDPRQTLQATALVHEVYRCLTGSNSLEFESREHFFNCARTIMRQVIIRFAKRRQTLKRGSGIPMSSFNDHLGGILRRDQDPDALLAIDCALQHLAKTDPRKHQILELRFYVGFTFEEIANALNLSLRTVKRDWSITKKWLTHAVSCQDLAVV